MVRGEVPTSWGSERRGWHIDKTLSAGDLLAIATILITIGIPLIVWGVTVETRFASLATLERRIETEKNARDAQRFEDRQASQQSIAEVKTRLDRIDDKIEKIAEKVGAQK